MGVPRAQPERRAFPGRAPAIGRPMQDRIIRVGTVPYLNAEPLSGALRERESFPTVRLLEEVPSLLLQDLLRRELDVGLVSTAGVLPEPGLRILPSGCVAARGAVRSIQIYSATPLAGVRTMALDASSRSASALARLFFRYRFDRDPEYLTVPPELDQMLERADAALLIGNPALRANHRIDSRQWRGPRLSRTDLGAEWEKIAGLPFVYAVWAVPEALEPGPVLAVLDRALALGLDRRAALAREGAEALGIPRREAEAYLLDTIRYRLGPEERSGLERFCELGREYGVLPEDSAVRYA